MREFDSVLKKLAESGEAVGKVGSEGALKTTRGWLGGPLKGSASSDLLATPQSSDQTQPIQPQPSTAETPTTDYEGFKAQISSSKASRGRQSAQSSQTSKSATSSPAEMIYFPQTPDEPVPIQLAGLKKGASSAEMYALSHAARRKSHQN